MKFANVENGAPRGNPDYIRLLQNSVDSDSWEDHLVPSSETQEMHSVLQFDPSSLVFCVKVDVMVVQFNPKFVHLTGSKV